jgi:hypothetical protein
MLMIVVRELKAALYTPTTSAAENYHSAAEIIFDRKGSHSLMTELLCRSSVIPICLAANG